MNTTHEDAVLNFDLDFLHPATNNIPVPAPKLKYITQLKRRIIRVDALQNYTSTINQELTYKSKELEEVKKKIETTTQEYRQTSLDYKDALQSSTACEKENERLKVTIKKLEEERFKAVNDYEAIKSYVAQLEQLVKQQERKLDMANHFDKKKADKLIEDRINAKTKENDKEILFWKKKYESLEKEFRDLKCAYTELNEQSQKQEKFNKEVQNEFISSDNSENEDDISANAITTISKPKNVDTIPGCPTAIKNCSRMELDNFSNNEIVSVDLGYGSSLASSDNEKWLNSPDYVFSPINGENIENNTIRKLVNIATSPIHRLGMTEIATSPIQRLGMSELAMQRLEMTEMATSPIRRLGMTEKATSPIQRLGMTEMATSPIQKLGMSELVKCPVEGLEMTEMATSPIRRLRVAEKATTPKQRLGMTEIATSPIQSLEMTEMATSPMKSVKMVDVALSPRKSPLPDSDSVTQSPSVIITAKRADSPSNLNIRSVTNISDNSTNIFHHSNEMPGAKINKIVNKEPEKNRKNERLQNIPGINIEEMQEKNCLEMNNSNNIAEDCSADNEIEMILNVMRLNHKLITPIPETPRKTDNQSTDTYGHVSQVTADSRHSSCTDAAIAIAQATAAREEAASAKEYALKTREENAKLMTTLNNLMNGMITIKSFLKNQMCMPDIAVEHTQDVLITNETISNIEATVNENLNQFSECSEKAKLDTFQTIDMDIAQESIKPIDKINYGDISVSNTRQEMDKEDSVEHNVHSTQATSYNSENIQMKSPIKDVTVRKGKRYKKLTNLAKYRKKCEVRKYKIRRETPPLSKPLKKPKQLRLIKHITERDTSATLNDTDVYAKAVRVMAELNAKTKGSKCLESGSISGPRHEANSQEYKNIDEYQEHADPNSIESVNAHTKLMPISTETVIISTKPNLNGKEPFLKEPKIILPRCPIEQLQKSGISPTKPAQSKKSIDIVKKALDFEKSPKKITTAPTVKCSIISSDIKSTELPLAVTESVKSNLKQFVTTPDICYSSQQKSNNIALGSAVKASPKPGMMPSGSTAVSLTNAITSPKLNASLNTNCISSVPSRVTRSQSKHENELSGECLVALHSDSNYKSIPQQRHHKILNAVQENKNDCGVPITQMQRKRKISNTSESNCKIISCEKQMTNTKEDYTTNKKLKCANWTAENVSSQDFKESLMCGFIEKYGVKTVKQVYNCVSVPVLNKVSETIEEYVLKLKKSPSQDSSVMNELVVQLQTYDYKTFVSGLMHYLINPERKIELYSKSAALPAPPMTRSEQIMLYVLRQLRSYWSPKDTVETVLSVIEHTLFKLNRTPEFGIIESVAHFYALLCRYFVLKSRLIVFMLDAMYCIQFKSIPLIQQCLDVWPHIIPLAHMSIAKIPLVTCFVYLLHFYKCNDKFNRVDAMRTILHRKYFYQITEWNEPKLLELITSAILELKDIALEKKMLRTALIILGKRHGPRWTQNNIIKKIFQPIIENDRGRNHIKAFCVSLIGPLMKPYPADMKANCEHAMNQLMDILKETTSREIEEAAMTSLIIMGRHNQKTVTEMLLQQKMRPLSPELEDILCHHIRLKPINEWLKVLYKMPVSDSDESCK